MHLRPCTQHHHGAGLPPIVKQGGHVHPTSFKIMRKLRCKTPNLICKKVRTEEDRKYKVVPWVMQMSSDFPHFWDLDPGSQSFSSADWWALTGAPRCLLQVSARQRNTYQQT